MSSNQLPDRPLEIDDIMNVIQVPPITEAHLIEILEKRAERDERIIRAILATMTPQGRLDVYVSLKGDDLYEDSICRRGKLLPK